MKKMSIKLKYNGVPAVNVYVQGQIQVRSDTVEETMHTGEKKQQKQETLEFLESLTIVFSFFNLASGRWKKRFQYSNRIITEEETRTESKTVQ